jgi:hypothetical protein
VDNKLGATLLMDATHRSYSATDIVGAVVGALSAALAICSAIGLIVGMAVAVGSGRNVGGKVGPGVERVGLSIGSGAVS